MDTFLLKNTEQIQAIKKTEGELTHFLKRSGSPPTGVGTPPQADDVPSYACRHFYKQSTIYRKLYNMI